MVWVVNSTLVWFNDANYILKYVIIGINVETISYEIGFIANDVLDHIDNKLNNEVNLIKSNE